MYTYSGSWMVCTDFLNRRHNKAIKQGNHAPAKWIEFCRKLLERGCIIHLDEYDSIQTKHFQIRHRRDLYKVFRVRFSPIPPDDDVQNCGLFDFFCGADGGNADQAYEAALDFLGHNED